MTSATTFLLCCCFLFVFVRSNSKLEQYQFATDLKTIDNGIVELGIDLQRGGSITYLSQSKKNFSIINIHDMGREVQLSFYAGSANYEPSPDPGSEACNTSWHHW